MKIPALLTLLFVSAANAYPTADTPSYLHAARRDSSVEHYAELLLTRLENKVKLSTTSLPKLDFTKEWQYVCAPNIWEGDQVAFWRTGSFGPKDIKSTHAYYVAHVESTAVNTGALKDDKIVVTESTTTTQVKTDGWTIGAKLSGTGGKKDVASGTVEVSGSYSKSQSDTNSGTKTVSHEAFCAPGHECRIETWTFHLDVQANATLLANWQLWALRYGYDEERHICDMEPYMRDCDQFASRHDEWCDPEQSGVNSAGNFGWNLQPRYEIVRTKIPVYEENGYQPMSRVVLVSTPINDLVGQMSEPAEVGTRESIAQAIEIGTKFQFLD
ncbi:hypothetical protein MY11210_005023 [Beauveria gryllotalpidicola]